jgi:hypothetical protein
VHDPRPPREVRVCRRRPRSRRRLGALEHPH